MTVIKSEFFLALNQVATERGISPDDVIESIKGAVLAAYKKDYGVAGTEVEEDTEENIEVKINKDNGETQIFIDGKDVTPAGFGRIAAQTARQVILQKIREAEKKHIIKHYITQVGTLIKGRTIRFEGKNIYLDIGKAEGYLPYSEQIKNEHYRLNETYVVYIKEIKEDAFGNSKIIVSRADNRLIEELFRREVPEVENGTVKIKNVVREPGERAKIAVFSDQSGVDPVGACVGQKGIRVKAVTDELGGDEKIDIIQWNADDVFFLREALSPATVLAVEINKDQKRAKITVAVDQAPLAIGRNGVNVNLASKLTDFEIDIVQESGESDQKKSESEEAVENEDKKNESEKSQEEAEQHESSVEPQESSEEKNTPSEESAL